MKEGINGKPVRCTAYTNVWKCTCPSPFTTTDAVTDITQLVHRRKAGNCMEKRHLSSSDNLRITQQIQLANTVQFIFPKLLPSNIFDSK